MALKQKRTKGVQTTDRARAIYKSLPKRPGVVTTQSYLRLEQVLGTQGNINFQVLTNEGTPNVNERRLAISDSFMITSIFIGIYKVGAATPTNAQIAGGVLNTYPNSITYSKAGEAANLQGIYNGYLSIRVNSVVYIDSLDCFRFYRVSTAQKGVNVSAAASNNAYVSEGYEKGDFPFYALTPGIRLSGATKNELQVTLPTSLDLTGTSSTNYAVCYLRGFLEQNGAQFNPAGR